MGEAILVTSGKGGSGKSTFTVNCGAALADLGKKVLLVDSDAGLRALDIMLSVSNKVIYDLSDVLTGRCEPIKAIIDTSFKNLQLLPAPLTADDSLMEPDGMKRLCRGLTHYYDYVIIDSSAGVGTRVLASVAAADRVIIVSTPDPVSIRDADRVAAVVLSQGVENLRLVINRVKPRLIRKKAVYGLDTAIDEAAVQLIGVVPEDEKIILSTYKGMPVTEISKTGAALAFANIARRILGEDIPLMKL